MRVLYVLFLFLFGLLSAQESYVGWHKANLILENGELYKGEIKDFNSFKRVADVNGYSSDMRLYKFKFKTNEGKRFKVKEKKIKQITFLETNEIIEYFDVYSLENGKLKRTTKHLMATQTRSINKVKLYAPYNLKILSILYKKPEDDFLVSYLARENKEDNFYYPIKYVTSDCERFQIYLEGENPNDFVYKNATFFTFFGKKPRQEQINKVKEINNKTMINYSNALEKYQELCKKTH